MKDCIALHLNMEPLPRAELNAFENEYREVKSFLPKLVSGKMHEEVKKAISNTLMGHKVSKKTREKIAKTISERNKEGKCGFSLGHSSISGSKGGKSRSKKKIDSLLVNQKKSLETIRGSSWMINPATNIRKRVPKHMIEEFLNSGYVLGAITKGRG
jgi:hypothetical protein